MLEPLEGNPIRISDLIDLKKLQSTVEKVITEIRSPDGILSFHAKYYCQEIPTLKKIDALILLYFQEQEIIPVELGRLESFTFRLIGFDSRDYFNLIKLIRKFLSSLDRVPDNYRWVFQTHASRNEIIICNGKIYISQRNVADLIHVRFREFSDDLEQLLQSPYIKEIFFEEFSMIPDLDKLRSLQQEIFEVLSNSEC